MAKIGMIGAGSWGIALSVLLANNGHEVLVWSIIEDEIKMLKENGVEVKKEIPVPATYGLVPVCVMAVSALVMVICGLLMKKPKFAWLGDYALPISLILGMASAIPITAWLG